MKVRITYWQGYRCVIAWEGEIKPLEWNGKAWKNDCLDLTPAFNIVYPKWLNIDDEGVLQIHYSMPVEVKPDKEKGTTWYHVQPLMTLSDTLVVRRVKK